MLDGGGMVERVPPVYFDRSTLSYNAETLTHNRIQGRR